MKRVLVVEDDEMVQELMSRILEKLGASFYIAGNRDKVEEAMTEVQTFDLAIVDLIMPFVTGWEVIDRIRSSSGKAATMPIVVLTGASVSDQEKDRLLKKVQEVVWKGHFTFTDFVTTLKRWI
ncbi:MAG: response regulator [Lentisphaerota bacterium]